MAWQACSISHAPAVLLVWRELVHLLQTERESSSLALSTGNLTLGLPASSGNAILDVWAEHYWETGLRQKLEGLRPGWPAQVPCAMSSEAPSASVTAPTVASWKAHKTLCAVRGLCPPLQSQKAGKVFQMGWTSVQSFNTEKSTYLCQPDGFLFGVSLNFPWKGPFCICPSWSVTRLHCLADRNVLFFLTKTFLL